MNLEAQKLAVCGKLTGAGILKYFEGDFYFPNSNLPVKWPTEGLQVCHEAEKLLIRVELEVYGTLLFSLPNNQSSEISSQRKQYCSDWNRRLEALCRVWWPERFV